MPIFEYRCKACEKEFEALVLGRDKPRCPACDGGKLEKLLSSFSAVTGSSSGRRADAVGPCGACGDPRGPGSCSMN